MKLVSYLADGRESWGALLPQGVVDLQSRTGLGSLAEFLGSPLYDERAALVRGAATTAPQSVTWLPVIPRPEKIFCTVRNYLDHHQETVATGIPVLLTDMPPIFLRTWRSQCAHEAPIVRPRVSDTLDWEGELAVVIGRGGRDIPEAMAFEHVAGYACYNDASVREWQFHAKQIAAGKNFEATGAFGPWMVTADEIAPERSLKIETRLNGEVVQSSETRHMIFGVARLIAYVSTIVSLAPGDVIVTGTPAGVGQSRVPPRFMQAGDVCEVEIEGIGVLRNRVVEQASVRPN